eukprot:sb/3475272/
MGSVASDIEWTSDRQNQGDSQTKPKQALKLTNQNSLFRSSDCGCQPIRDQYLLIRSVTNIFLPYISSVPDLGTPSGERLLSTKSGAPKSGSDCSYKHMFMSSLFMIILIKVSYSNALCTGSLVQAAQG